MIIAIDPGLKGGIAWEKDGHVFAKKMPDTIKGIRDMLDCARLGFGELHPDFIGDDPKTMTIGTCSATELPAVCYLEDVHSMSSQGVKSTWTFAEHYGALKAILLCLGISMEKVSPQVWQKAIGASRPSVPKDATKAQREAARREGKHKIKEIVEARYPNIKVTLATADALGILMYAEKKEKK